MMNLVNNYQMILDDLEGFPRHVRTRWQGALTISTDGEATIRGKATTAAIFSSAGEVERVVFNATATRATINHGLSLSDLKLADLLAVAQWAAVDTSAQTAAGLRRAIERHLEEGG